MTSDPVRYTVPGNLRTRLPSWVDVHRTRWYRASRDRRRLQNGLVALERAGLPEAVRQQPLELLDGEVIHLDIAWPDIRFAVEPGASWWHGGDAQLRRDQLRDLSCGEVGWMVLRVDDTMAEDADALARRLRRAHRARERDIRRPSAPA